MSCSNHAQGGQSDLDNLQLHLHFHKYDSRKRSKELNIGDEGDGNEDFLGLQAILFDSKYQEIKYFLRLIHPITKLIGRILTHSENKYNTAASSDRIVVEA